MMSNCWWKAEPKWENVQTIGVIRLTFNYLNMNELYVKLNEDMKNVTPADSFGLAKSIKKKIFLTFIPFFKGSFDFFP